MATALVGETAAALPPREYKAAAATWSATASSSQATPAHQRGATTRFPKAQAILEFKTAGGGGGSNNTARKSQGVSGPPQTAGVAYVHGRSLATNGCPPPPQSAGSVLTSPQSAEEREYRSLSHHSGREEDLPLPSPRPRLARQDSPFARKAGGFDLDAHEEGGRNRASSSTAAVELGDGFLLYGHSWPILLAVVPPLGSVFFGNSEAWSDFLLIFLIAIYLYLIIKVPWELYYAAVEREPATEASYALKHMDQVDSQTDACREHAATSLRRQKHGSLCLIVLSPLFGGWTLHLVRASLSEYDKYFSNFNVLVFVMAASMRPLGHIIRLAKQRALLLQQQAHFPYGEVDLLRRQVRALELEMASLKEAAASAQKAAEDATKQATAPGLEELSRAIKRAERRDDFLRGYSEERFHQLENRVRHQEKLLQLAVVQVMALRGLAKNQASKRQADGGVAVGRRDGEDGRGAKQRQRRTSLSSVIASTALFPVTSIAWLCGLFFRLPTWLSLPSPHLKLQSALDGTRQRPDNDATAVWDSPEGGRLCRAVRSP